jgi:flagellar motor switch protein FliM
MEARVGDCMEQIQIGFPYPTIEPLVRKLGLKLKPEAGDTTAQANAPRWRRDLEKIQIKITAECPSVRMKARELINLKVGDVIPLEPDLFSRVQLRLAKLSKFNGTLGAQDKKMAVEITKILRT